MPLPEANVAGSEESMHEQKTLSYAAVCSHTREPRNRGRMCFGGVFIELWTPRMCQGTHSGTITTGPDSYSYSVPERVIYVPPPLSLVNRKPR